MKEHGPTSRYMKWLSLRFTQSFVNLNDYNLAFDVLGYLNQNELT